MKAEDGARGSVYRWRSWFVRIFGWNCGYLITPAAFGHRFYARWVFKPEQSAWGIWWGRDEDDERTLDVALGPVVRIDTAWPTYVPVTGGTRDHGSDAGAPSASSDQAGQIQ